MASTQYPLQVPDDLMAEVEATALRVHLSKAAVMRQSIKLGLPKLREQLSVKAGRVTNVDPLRYQLPFERFFNTERADMPDIDMDFPDDRREDVIDYVTRKYGEDRVTDDPIEASYYQVYFWKLAVEKAGSIDVDEVRKALLTGQIQFDAPGGMVKVDPKTQHTFKTFRMGKTRDDKQFDIIYKTPSIEPDPYPQVAFPGWHADWTKGGVTKGAEVKIGD